MSEWLDLTQTLGSDCPTRPPSRPAPEFERYATLERDDYNGTRIHLDTHCGTHMDAPTHFFSSKEELTIDDVQPREMVTEGVVLDLTDVNPGTAVSAETLRAEAECRTIHQNDFVICDFGNPPRETDKYVHQYPHPSPGAAEYLVSEGISCVATDALGVDPPGACIDDHLVHRALLSSGIHIIEGVANLDALRPGRVDVICTPIPYEGCDGAQVRLLAKPR